MLVCVHAYIGTYTHTHRHCSDVCPYEYFTHTHTHTYIHTQYTHTIRTYVRTESLKRSHDSRHTIVHPSCVSPSALMTPGRDMSCRYFHVYMIDITHVCMHAYKYVCTLFSCGICITIMSYVCMDACVPYILRMFVDHGRFYYS